MDAVDCEESGEARAVRRAPRGGGIAGRRIDFASGYAHALSSGYSFTAFAASHAGASS